MEVVWAKSARGVLGLGHVVDGKLYFICDICEGTWIPKDLVPRKKSVPVPKTRAKPAPKQAGQRAQPGAKPVAKPAPSSVASSSSAGATHPVITGSKNFSTQRIPTDSVATLFPLKALYS